jgi:hypothetical protein
MVDKLHQAYYGEFRGGHDLLATSAPGTEFAHELKWLTDRPSAGAISWQPYLSGFPWREFYILMRTFPAPARPESRGGYVFTHALFYPTGVATSAGDLNVLVSHLVESIPADLPSKILPPISAISLNPAPGFDPDPRARAAARALLDHTPISRPVIWIGQEGFDEVVSRVWAGLWPEARAALSFRISLDPSDAERGSPTLVCTPVLSRTRWTGFAVVDVRDAVERPTPAELLLAGEPSALRRHIAELGVQSASISALRQVQTAVGLLDHLQEITPEDARLLVRVLAAISNEPADGKNAKSAAVERLISHVSTADAEYIATLRNLEPAPFPDKLQALGSAVEQWTATHFLTDLQELVSWMGSRTAHGWWLGSIEQGIGRAVRHWTVGLAPLIWAGIANDPTAARVMISLIADAAQAGSPLIDLARTCASKLPRSVADVLASAARDRQSVELFAATTDAGHGLEFALDALQKPGWREVAIQGMEILATRRGPDALVALAVARGSELLVSFAAILIARQPSLRGALDARLAAWRILWLQSIQAGADTWAGVRDPGHVRDSLLNAALDTQAVEDALLNEVAQTEWGDLADFSRQSEVWAASEFPVREAFLARTTAGWIDRFAADPEATTLPADAVLTRVIGTGGTLFLSGGAFSRDLHTAVVAFGRFPGWQENHFLGWLTVHWHRLSLLSAKDGARLGQLVSQREWRQGARNLFAARRLSPAVRTAVEQCTSLLGVFDVLRLSLESPGLADVDADAWFNGLFEVLVENYQHGPEEERIWQRAGGSLSHIEGRTPRERWRSAVHQLRSGRSVGVSIDRLLQELRADLSNNSDLNVLYEAFKQQR